MSTTPVPSALAAGDAFVAAVEDRDAIARISDAQLVDMNTYGLAVACQRFATPVGVFRVVSDHADESASETFRKFVGSYQGDGGNRLAQVLLTMPPSPTAPEAYPSIREALAVPAAE